MKQKNKHEGSDFRDFLAEEGILEEVEASALKRAIAYKLDQARKKASISKAQMARQMNTSRAAVDRLLDEKNPSLTLATVSKAATALGCRISFELKAA